MSRLPPTLHDSCTTPLPCPPPPSAHPQVFNKRVIAMHYIRGWLLIDVISVVPFWTLTLDYSNPLNRGVSSPLSSTRSSTLRATVLVRIVKVCPRAAGSAAACAARRAQRRRATGPCAAANADARRYPHRLASSAHAASRRCPTAPLGTWSFHGMR